MQEEEKWIVYKLDQRSQDVSVTAATEKGELRVEGITFALGDGFKAGNYEIVISDVTLGIEDDEKLLPQRLDLRIFDSEAEAEVQAA